MTLFQIIQILKEIALAQPNIKSATDGSIYDIMNTNPSVKYDVVHFSQTTHQSDEETDYYGLNIFYVSRLEDSLEDNRLQIQSIGKEVLDNIIRTFCENWGIDFPVITYTPFTQKFNDLCAGCYCNLRLEIPKEIICADDYVAEVVPGSGIKLQDIGITITQNGLIVVTPDAEYDGIGEVRIEVDVPQSAAVLQDKEVEYTENGSYSIHPDPAYDGLSSVSVDVDVPDRYDEGYDDGKDDGEAEQKAKLTVTSFTENNTYTRENGWSAVTVNVPQTGMTIYNQNISRDIFASDLVYAAGHYMGNQTITHLPYYTGIEKVDLYIDIDASAAIEQGENQQKAKLTVTSFTENNTYTRENGWSAVTVDVDDRYEEGFEDGKLDQKARLEELFVTSNGIYVREDGYSSVYVTVPQTGDADLIANLQGDYYLIPYGTTHLRDYAFYYTCFSSITIPTTVSAIGAYAFAENRCLTSITIPDSVQSLGNNAFRNCRNLQTAILGNGLTQLESSTFVYCTSLTGITIPSGITNISNSVFNSCSGLTEMTFEGLTPPTIDTGNSLGSKAYTFPIYVPCQSLDAYKTAFGENYAPRIQCREQEMITAITLNVSSAITDSETATTTYSPSNAYVDYYYTSSNPSIATIDPNTGIITVVANGSVTICTIDRISGLQDCKTITVNKSQTVATAITLIVDSAITDSGDAYVIVNPQGAETDLTFTSSDTEIATIDHNGHITVVSDGQVTFCVYDAISGLEDCKTVTVTKTTHPSSGYVMIVYNVTSTTSPTKILSNTSGVTRAELENGTQIPIGTGYTFGTLGRVSVWYKFKNDKIEFGTFRDLPQVVEANIGQGIKRLMNSIFKLDSALTSVTIANSVTGIGINCFEKCTSLTEITIPDSVKEELYLRFCFLDCTSLSSATLGSGFTILGTQAFHNCGSLTSLQIPDSYKQIESAVCTNCYSLSSLTLPSGVTSIGMAAFRNCAIKEVTFPASINTIADQAFSCDSSHQVKYISMTFNGLTPPTLGSGQNALGDSGAMADRWANVPIYVPASAVETYKTAWPYYANRIQAKP